MPMPRLSVITPTILRPSLERLCLNVDRQTNQDYEHLIVVDIPCEQVTVDQKIFLEKLAAGRPNRKLFFCKKRHMNYGNTCRHQITPLASGDYMFYIDDDDDLMDDKVFESLAQVKKDVVIFPMMLYGRYFFYDPPGVTRGGTGGFAHRRGIGVWPDSDVYETDGYFLTDLAGKFPYEVIKDRALVTHPSQGKGRYY